MTTQSNLDQRRMCRKSPRLARLDGQTNARQRDQSKDTTQLIYAHLPPAVVLATEQHLRAQTKIEQRARELWFNQGCLPGNALGDWIRAEYDVVQQLCQALLGRNHREPETGLVPQ
jgi:hypothetical protein